MIAAATIWQSGGSRNLSKLQMLGWMFQRDDPYRSGSTHKDSRCGSVMTSVAASSPLGSKQEIVARQGLRLPAIMLKRLRGAGIYCQPTISIEYQRRAKSYVLRGVESGGAVPEIRRVLQFRGMSMAARWHGFNASTASP